MSDYEIDFDESCPKCSHEKTHYRDCTGFCENGYIDESEDDPINFYPGESERRCSECRGTGIEKWCPNCGVNLSGFRKENECDSIER